MVATAVAVPVALPLTLTLPLAVIVEFDEILAEPYLALSTEIETVALALTVALPPTVKFAVAVVEDVTLDVALAPLITEPFAVVFTEVVETPLMRAEPSGTLLALQVILALAFTVADVLCCLFAVQDVEELALAVAEPSRTAPVEYANLPYS